MGSKHMKEPIQTAAWLAITLLVAPMAASGEEPPVLTLERAIEIALDGNRDLRAAQARLEAAAAGVDEARSYRLPKLELDGIYQHTDNPVLVFSNLLGQANFQTANFALDTLNEPDPLGNWKARIRLSQPLYTGGRVRAGIEAAGLARDAAELDRETARQRLIHQVVDSYGAAVLARGELEVTRESLATARAHVELVGDLRRGGLVVESDLLQAEVRESEVRELEIRAQSGTEIATAALNLALGRSLDTPIALPAGVPRSPAGDGHDDTASDNTAGDNTAGDNTAGDNTAGDGDELARLVEAAGRRRPDLEAARQRRQASERVQGVERAANLPEVGMNASYEMNAEDFFGADGDNWAVTVGLRFDLFDGGRRRARVRQAEERTREAEERTELLAQMISLEVRRAFFELRAARQRLEQAGKGVELAERSLEIIEDRYREGLTILPELLDAETALTRSRLRRIAAQRDVLLARATLDLATGDL